MKFRRRTVWLGAGAVCLIAIPAALLRIVPEGSIGLLQNRLGRSNPHLLLPGIHWRIPAWESVYVYPRRPHEIAGRVQLRSHDGIEVEYPYSFLAEPTEERILLAHREVGARSAYDWIRRNAEEALHSAGRRAASYQLLREALPTPLASDLIKDLRRIGMVEGSLQTGPGTVSPDILARFRPEELARRRRNTGTRVAIVGLDGADWDFALPMIERGELPNLARLRREGASGKILTGNPPLSPLLWTTVATGKSPDLHGITDFLVLDSAHGQLTPITSEFRKVKAMWNIASDAGLTSEFVAWWATWPAEPIRGIMVSDRVSYSLFSFVERQSTPGRETFPEGYFQEIQPRLKTEASVSLADLDGIVSVTEAELTEARTPAARRGEKGEDLESLATLIRVISSTENYKRISLDLLGRKQPDLFAVYFQGIDEVNHRFAHLAPPRMPGVSAERFRKFSGAVAGFYRLQDRILGEILARLAPDTTLIVLSDHGFLSGPHRPKDLPPFISGQPGLWHAPFGILVLWGDHVKRGPLATASLYDVLPTVLDLLGLPPSEDLPGRSLRSALEPDFTGGRSLPPIASYEAYGDPLRPAREGSGSGSGAAAGEALVETLRSLGYIGPAPTAKPSSSGAGTAPNASTTALYHANLASILMAKGDREGAEREYRQALRSNPDTLSALLGLSRLEEARGHPDQALILVQRVVERNLNYDPVLFVRMAELFHQAGRVEDGLLYFQRIAAHAPSRTLLDTALGVLYSRRGDKVKAEAALRQALTRDPMALPPMEELFVLYDQEGKVPALIPELEKAVRSEESSFMHHNWLGLAYRRIADFTGAEKEFQRAMELGPEQVGPAANLGSLYLQEGRTEQAVGVLEKALSRDASSAEVRTNLIVALGRLKRLDEAREKFEDGQRLTPGRPSLYNAMAFAYQSSGRRREAAELLRSSLRMDPNQPQAQQLLREVDPEAAARLSP